MLSIGEKVRYIRKVHKLTQNLFSTALEISQRRLSEIEKDVCKPSADTLISLAKEFNVNLYWVFIR